jgi:hypothetical protein
VLTFPVLDHGRVEDHLLAYPDHHVVACPRVLYLHQCSYLHVMP